MLPDVVRRAVAYVPSVWPYLSAKARWMATRPIPYRTYDYYLRTLQHMIQMVYDGHMGGEFQDILADLIHGQMSDAFERAAIDQGFGVGEAPERLREELAGVIETEYPFITPFYQDIVDARIDKLPVEPLLSRAELWANRWNEAYNRAIAIIAAEMGQKLVWRLGPTKEHCSTCRVLNGIVAFAAEWEQSGFYPQSPPNPMLECGGWRCECRLEVTDHRRSPNALSRLLDLATGGGL